MTRRWFVKFPDMVGSGKSLRHKGWVEALDDPTSPAPGGAGRRPVALTSVTIVKAPDRATPKLMQAVAQHKVLASVFIEEVDECERPKWRLTLTRAQIASFTHRSVGDALREQLTLVFSGQGWALHPKAK